MYKCNDCGHVFMGSDFTTTCPECGSTSIEVVKKPGGLFDKTKEWILNNKPLASVICIILLLFLFRNCKNDEQSKDNLISNDKIVYKLSLFERGDHIEVSLKDSENKESSSIPYSPSKFSWLDLSASIIDENGIEYLVSINNNKISYCIKGVLTIKWKYDKKRLSPLNQSGFSTYDEESSNLISSNSQNCLPLIKVNDVSSDLCNKTIYVNVDPKLLSSEILVSINGKNGDYSVKKSRSFPKKVSNFDVWIYHKDFPDYKFQYTGELPSIEESNGCSLDTDEMKNTIVSAINSSNYLVLDENIEWFSDNCVIVYNNNEYPVLTFVSETETFAFQKSATSISISANDIEMSCCLINKIKLN